MTASLISEIEKLLPLVRTIAWSIKRKIRTADFDDLVGDGCVGLMRAASTYDSTHGLRLAFWARSAIYGEMIEGLRRLDPMPKSLRKLIRMAEERRFELAQEFGEMPTQAQLEAVDPRLSRAFRVASERTIRRLDDPNFDAERVVAGTAADPTDVVVDAERTAWLREALASLTMRQRELIDVRYRRDFPWGEVKHALRICSSGAWKLHDRAIARMRASLSVS